MDRKEAANSDSSFESRSPELMNAGDTLLCLVDLQQRLLPAIPAHERIVWNARRLVDGAKVLGVEVVATEQYPEKLGPTVKPLASLLDQQPASKLTFSSATCRQLFTSTTDRASANGRHRVLLAGVEAHVCVQQTAYDLLAAGWWVYLATDAIGSRFPHDFEIALRRMESAGVVLTTTEAALFEWCEVSGTPEFKQISGLIREEPPS